MPNKRDRPSDSVSPLIPTIGVTHLAVLAQVATRGEQPAHSPLQPGEAEELILALGRMRGQSGDRSPGDLHDK